MARGVAPDKVFDDLGAPLSYPPALPSLGVGFGLVVEKKKGEQLSVAEGRSHDFSLAGTKVSPGLSRRLRPLATFSLR